MDNLLALPNGTVLAEDYRLERVLGAGGFGITYLAEELALHRKVAIKEYFPGEFAARDGASQVRHRSESDRNDYTWGLERFIEEAQTLARFDHDNIVRVYRYFRANNTAYMVLKFEEGQSIRQWVDSLRKAPTQDQLDCIIAPTLDALELIHGHDFLHRDIAADNILLRRDGSPVLIDFGSARGEVASHTKTLSALVKPGYSPFEQYASNGKQQGPWTDIYAFAATLYLTIAGQRPPDSPSRITADEYVPAAKAAKGKYRPSFLNAIDHALQLQVNHRPQSIAAWRNALLGQAHHSAARPVPVQAVAATVRATRKIEGDASPNLVWKKKQSTPLSPTPLRDGPASPRAAGAGKRAAMAGVAHIGQKAGALPGQMMAGGRAGAAAAQGAVAGFAAKGKMLVGRVSAARPGMPGLPKLPAVSLPSVKGTKAALSKLRISRHGKSTRARRSLIKDLEAELAKPLGKQAPKDKSPARASRANKADTSWWRRLFQGQTPTHAARAKKIPPRAVRKAPRKTSPARRLWWLTGMAARLAAIIGFVSFLVIKPKPESEPVVAAWSREQAPASADTLGLIRTYRGHSAPVTTLAISEDGRQIASVSRDGQSMIWKSRNGRAIGRLDPGTSEVTAIDMAGTRLVMAQADGNLTLWDVQSGKRARVFKRHNGAVHAAVFGQTATQFFSAGADERLRIWNSRRGSWRSLRGHKGAVIALAASKNGRTLVSGGEDRTVKLWNASRRKVVKTLHAHDSAITSVAISAEGNVFASGSADESIRIYPDRGDGEIKTLYGHKGAVTALAFSPSGRLLASAGADHAVKLWNVKTGALLHTFVGHTDRVTALEFMPDGRRLVTASIDKTVRIWHAQVAGF